MASKRAYVTQRLGYDPYDMEIGITYPYSYYSIDKDEFFPKYIKGDKMTRAQLVHLETMGLYTKKDDEYVLIGDSQSVVMDPRYAEASGFKRLIDESLGKVKPDSPEDDFQRKVSIQDSVDDYISMLKAKLES